MVVVPSCPRIPELGQQDRKHGGPLPQLHGVRDDVGGGGGGEDETWPLHGFHCPP